MLRGRVVGMLSRVEQQLGIIPKYRAVPIVCRRNISFFSFFKKKEDKKESVPHSTPSKQVLQPKQTQQFKALKPASMEERYRACMILAGVGDAVGYNNGKWEFTYSGVEIHEEYEKLGGLSKLNISKMMVSDDQTMHLATAEALVEKYTSREELLQQMAKCYVESFRDMMGRAPGPTTEDAVNKLASGIPYDCIPYSPAGGGCGGSMRAMCIGLRYPGENQRDDLIAVSIDSARMTHNHPTGFFGALCSALFTAYAIEGVPVVEWGRKMVKEVLPRAYEYIEKKKRNWDKYQDDLLYFENAWTKYLKERDIWENNKPVFPEKYDHPGRRDYFYYEVSFKGWGGSSGHDSVIIAYDALLGAGNDFEELIKRGALHGGDNDSTGVISCGWWGAIYGLEAIPRNIWENVEKRQLADVYGKELYKLGYSEK